MQLTTTMKACLVTGALGAGLTAAVGPGFAVAAVETASETVQEVFITNDRANPVPVDLTTKTITINGTADVSGSTVTVTGENGEALPVEVTNGGTPEPFQFAGAASSNVTFAQLDFVQLPADRRLTVTNFSITDTTEDMREASLIAVCDGKTVGLSTGEIFEQGDRLAIHEPTTLEVPAGCSGRAVIKRGNKYSGTTSHRVYVTGYYTPVAPPAS